MLKAFSFISTFPTRISATGTESNRTNTRSHNNREMGTAVTTLVGTTMTYIPEIGAVLGISSEQRDMKNCYMHLIEKLVAYISRDSLYGNARDVIPLLLKLEDPMAILEKKKHQKN